MKKSFLIVCLALILALACIACIACDPKPNNDGDNDSGLNDYESATYTVTFNVNSSDFKMENSVINDVPAGSTISEPCDSQGNKVKPYKTGYTFKYWSADGTSEFNFATDTINAPTTLTAIYTNNVYSHELGEGFYVDKKLEITADAGGKLSYELKDNDNGATMSSGTTLDLTYATTSNLACPTPAEGDAFLFWFYMKDGKPVQLTKIKADGQVTVATLEKYSKAGYLTIYAMFKSTLPKVEVTFEGANITESFPVNETISGTYTPNDKAGYVFDRWYYEVEDEDGDVEEIDFDFTTEDNKGTSLYSACSLSDYFTPAKLKLLPRWIKQINIGSVQDYEDIYNLLHKEEPTDDELAQIKEILSADIVIGNIDFAGKEFEPLFDADHVFDGTIKAEAESGAKLTNLKIVGTTHLSWLGYVTGEVANVGVEMTVTPSVVDGKYGNKMLIAGIATQNSGRIENCDAVVKLEISSADSTPKALVVGGIVAINNGKATVKNSGNIYDCTAEISLANCHCESLVLGGIVAQGNSASTIYNCTVKSIKVENSKCENDGNASNGSAFAKIGGIMASNGGSIESCAVLDLSVVLESRDETYFGGICADNSGSIKKSYVNAETVKLSVGGGVSPSVCIGGLVGTNEGYVHNAYCNADIDVSANRSNAIISIGGLVGNNISAKSDSTSSQTIGVGAINCAYAVGSINLNSENNVGTTVYVGGIIGRNSAVKISSCFTLVDIEVVNGNNGVNKIGNLLGSMEKDETVTKFGAGLQYAKDNKLTLNGESVQSAVNVGSSDALKDAFKKDKTNYEALGIKFDFNEVWEIVEGSLPTLR